MKKETCPFCGHRWIISVQESIIKCPNCNSKYYCQKKLIERQKKLKAKKL